MAIYAIGDLQGCFSELEQLLSEIEFSPQLDQLWFVGDLVNRGPQSLDTIEFIRALPQQNVKCVLGNHDIHLIACHAGIKNCKPNSSLNQILNSKQAEDIVFWLRQQPLLHACHELNWVMVHAGFLPEWDLKTALECASEVEQQLRSDQYADFLKYAYGNQPDKWDKNLRGRDRSRIILNAFTRLRMCDQQGRMNFDYKGPLGMQPKHLHAWFELPRNSADINIIFGHWSALGLVNKSNLLALDTGCIWGNELTAARIDVSPVTIHQIQCNKQK